MKELLKFALILGCIAAVSATALAYVYAITQPKILLQQEKELNEALQVVIPETESGVILSEQDSTGKEAYYAAYQNADTSGLIGYAVLAESKGYSSTIRTLVGVDTSYDIFRIKVLSEQETPGLGTRCEEVKSGETTPWWQNQFAGQPGADVALAVDGGSIQAITGATITSRAVTNGIASSVSQLKESLTHISE